MSEEPPAFPPPPPMMVHATGQRTDGLAIASLILGILAIPGALFYGVFGVILGTIALVLGLVARGRIKRSGGTVGGQGLATAGWIMGICGIVIGVLVLVVLIAFFASLSSISQR